MMHFWIILIIGWILTIIISYFATKDMISYPQEPKSVDKAIAIILSVVLGPLMALTSITAFFIRKK